MKLEDLYWFLGTFLLVYIIYLFLYVIGKNKKYNKDKVPIELIYLIRRYRLDIEKISYKKIMNQIGIISAFDIAFTATLLFRYVKNIYLSILVGAVMIVPLIIITFNLLGKIYVKKGKIKDGNKKN